MTDQVLHVGQSLVVDVGRDDVQAEVDPGLGFGPLQGSTQSLGQPLALVLHGEVDNGGGAAEGRRLGAALVSIRGSGVAECILHVSVHVDPAGQHQFPVRVDGLDIVADAEILADLHDAAVPTEDVRAVMVDSGNHVAVSDQ